MSVRAFAHPLAAGLLGSSVLVALLVEQRAPWSGRGAWVVAWGFGAYLAVVAVGIRRDVFERRSARATDRGASQERARAPRPPGPVLETRPSREDFVRLTQDALQHLNKADLGERALAHVLPHTIAAFATYPLGGPTDGLTPVLRTVALRAALVTCIERLKSAVGPGPAGADTLPFVILYEEYVLGRSNHSIMTRYSISESTFHRCRREATRVLADEMARQEELLAQLDPDRVPPRD